MPSQEVIEAVKTISIRGRVALATTCFQTACQALQVQNQEIDALTRYFWEFTSSRRLNEWEEGFPEGADFALEFLDDRDRNFYLREDKQGMDPIDKFPAIYLELPLVLLLIIEAMREIGQGNLYAGVVGWSEGTLKPTLRVLSYLERINVPVPDLGLFQRSSFSEYHGWGNPVPPSFFWAEP